MKIQRTKYSNMVYMEIQRKEILNVKMQAYIDMKIWKWKKNKSLINSSVGWMKSVHFTEKTSITRVFSEIDHPLVR